MISSELIEFIELKWKWINPAINKDEFIILLDNDKKSDIASLGSDSEKKIWLNICCLKVPLINYMLRD